MLEGKVTGTPKPEIKWYRGEKQLQEDSHILIESLPDGTQRLTLKNVEAADSAEYRCMASNEYGDVWSDVTLAVKGILEINVLLESFLHLF